MSDEMKICAATYFRTIGKEVTTTEEFVMTTSLEFKWMPPSSSKVLLKKLIEEGIITQKGDYLRPSFDPSSMDLPVIYKPSKEILEALKGDSNPKPVNPVKTKKPEKDVPPDMFHILIGIAKENGLDKGFVPKCSKIQKKIDVDICVAALLVLKDGGVDISGLYGKVHDSLKS